MSLKEDRIYITPEGLDKIVSELNHLVTVKREEVVNRLEIAISHGDLSENADYDHAKKDQAILEGRIQQLEDAIRRAHVINLDDESDFVRIGSTVSICEDGWEEAETYRIVGKHEADPIEGLISNESPIGTALIGAKVGDTVVALTPGGETRLKIQAIN